MSVSWEQPCMVLINFYWWIVDLQCVSFCSTAKCLSYTYTHIHSLFFRFFSQIGHYKVLRRVHVFRKYMLTYLRLEKHGGYKLFSASSRKYWDFPVAQMVKNLPAMQETCVWSLGQEDPLEEGMATHSSILVWRIPWTEEPGGLHSIGSQRLRYDWVTDTVRKKLYTDRENRLSYMVKYSF